MFNFLKGPDGKFDPMLAVGLGLFVWGVTFVVKKAPIPSALKP